MAVRVLLGTATGAVVSALSWFGNRVQGRVSTFPGLFTPLMLAALTCGAVSFIARGSQKRGALGSWKLGMPVAATAGVVFGLVVVLMGLARLHRPSPLLLAFGFFTALGAALMVGVLACVAVPRPRFGARGEDAV